MILSHHSHLEETKEIKLNWLFIHQLCQKCAHSSNHFLICPLLLLLLLLLIWQSPGLPGWRKVNLITVTRRPLHPSIAAGFYCLTTSPGFLPALCEKWSGFFYVHRVWLSYTRDRRLKVSSERLGNEDKAPCPRALLPGRGSNRGPPVWKSEVLTARPRQLHVQWATLGRFSNLYKKNWWHILSYIPFSFIF